MQPFPFVHQPPPPSPPSRGAGRFLRRMQGRRPGYKKSGIPRRISQTRVGRPEGRNSPLWCSFLHFSQEKWRPPAGTPPGRCAPRWVKAPTARRVRTTGGLAPRPHAAGLPCAKADGTTCPPSPTERQRPALAGLCLPVGKLETGKGYGQLPPKRARSRWKKEAFSGAFWAGAGGSGWWREVSIKTSWQSSRGWPFWGSFRR